MKNNRGH